MRGKKRSDLHAVEHPLLVDARGRPIRGGPITRRSFVKTSGGILVATALGSACAGADASTLGTVKVTITGLPTGLPDNGTAVITRTDIAGATPIDLTIPAGVTTGDVQVPAGTYHVVYTPPSGLQVNGVNAFDVTIVAFDITEVTVSVSAIATSGTLHVTVTGIAAGAATGGIAVLQRTDQTASPVTANVPQGGGVDTVVPTGTYTVTYTPPSAHSLNSGITNPQTGKVVTSGATTTCTFAVTASTGGAGVPGNISNHDFENNTFGPYTDGGNAAPPGWTIGPDAAKGNLAVHKTTGIGGSGGGLNINLNVGNFALYCRFAHKQDANADNNFEQKICRFQEAGFGGTNNPEIVWNAGSSNNFGIFFGFADASHVYSPTLNLPAPTPNQYRGQWHWFEIFFDYTTSGALVGRLWIDDVLYIDKTINAPRPSANPFQTAFLGGTVNSSTTQWVRHYDHIGWGTNKMGVPPLP